jgi:hypothetical protein
MFFRSLGAGSFAEFWRYWNPIFSYYLGRYVFKPSKRILPPALSLILTFIICGALHDAVSILFRGSFALLFTPWFLFMGLGVVIGNITGLEYSGQRWIFRAVINVFYIGACLSLAILLKI